ncbi:adenylate/guanylate cyclase domain-containing protein [Aestuariispira insulae]|uniref:Class 3 adenylate cyclase n=1 Tax=Aestuariispira insulae TaxID=1461337 RepID=A0A3D9HRY3_9PROT|nr:adenylate/guanylate cyclase domain-containing protein [Aestuariispira insulae]RED52257.1 class 3 adenylate cyclase [Aestuariispira insulae]
MSSRSTNYEVYYMQDGRWHLQASYNGEKREEAVEEAKSLEKEGHMQGACVVREAYNSHSNESVESVIYHSPQLKSKPNVSSISGGGPGGKTVKNAPPGSAAANAAKDAAEKEKKFQAEQRAQIEAERAQNDPALRQVPDGTADPCVPSPPSQPDYQEVPQGVDVIKLAISFFTASFAATLLTAIVFMILQMFGGNMIGRTLAMGILAVTFGMTFLAFFLPRLKRIIQEGAGVKRVKRRMDMPGMPDIPEIPGEAREYVSVYQPNKDGDSGLNMEGQPVQAATPEEKVAAAVMEEAGISSAQSSGQTAASAAPVPSNPFASADEVKSVADFEDVPDSMKGRDDGPVTGKAPLNRELKRIVTEAESKLGHTVLNDAYVRFGMILFLAGFAEPMAFCCRVSKEEGMEALVENVQKLGIDNSQARGFCLNVDEYLLDERYFGMYAAGRRAANWRINDEGAESGLIDAMKAWRTPPPPAEKKPTDHSVVPSGGQAREAGSGEEEQAVNKFVAVLFTDIVDSTSQQQSKGDEWLMKVVRAHNEIVRECLRFHNGREIKHTGDGIMASFPGVAESVESALAMQKGFARFRAAMPELSFGVRAGISAGEPIHEDGDIFGTPVNMAARVLNHAGDGEIAVSGIVREMCRGKGYGFESLGNFELKGFDEPQPIYRVALPDTMEKQPPAAVDVANASPE